MELKIQELFDNVDASQVSVSGAAALNTDRIKMLTLSRIQEKPRKRTAPRLLLAAALAATLALSALAYTEFRKYDHPEQMLEGFYGNTRQESVVGQKAPWGPLPDSIRVALDQEAAALVSPYIAAVDRSVSQGNCRLTVHGNLYDSITGCGILYYTLEDPAGISCRLDYDGMISGLPVYGGSRHGYTYVLKGESGDTRLEIAEYYIRGPGDKENYIEIGLALPEDMGSAETEFDRRQQAIQVPLEDGGGMPGLMGQGIRLSPVGMFLDRTQMEYPEDLERLRSLEIKFRDGSTYLVQDETHRNYVFGAGPDNDRLTLTLNRLVNVEQVEAVAVNGHEIREFRPVKDSDRLRYDPYVDQRGGLDSAESTPSGSICHEGMTLIPGALQYSEDTHQGLFACTLKTEEPEKLLYEGSFSPWEAGLQSNLMIRWECKKIEEDRLQLQGTFIKLEDAQNLKLWFEGSKADPRLETATENLICIPLLNTAGPEITLADGAIRVSDLGMVIDYEALGVQQESLPKDLSIRFSDGREKILSSWDEEILDCGWLWTGELRDSPEKKVYVSFLTPMEAENIESVSYAGRTYQR